MAKGKRIGRIELSADDIEDLCADGDWEKLAPLVTLLDQMREQRPPESGAAPPYRNVTLDVVAWDERP